MYLAARSQGLPIDADIKQRLKVVEHHQKLLPGGEQRSTLVDVE